MFQILLEEQTDHQTRTYQDWSAIKNTCVKISLKHFNNEKEDYITPLMTD